MCAPIVPDVLALKGAALRRSVCAATKRPLTCAQVDLKSQMRRAAISISSNTAEGSERGSDQEFRRFLCIAQASNAEVEAQATIAGDLGCIAGTTSDQLSQVVGRMIARFITTLDASG